MSNFQQMLFKFLDRPSQAGVATSAFMQGLQQARESKLQRERIAAQERRLDFDIQKANRDFQKEQIKNFETVGQNTAQAFGTAFEELNSNDSRANRVRVWKQLKGLQRDGLISDQVTIDPNLVLDPDADFKGFLQETSRELTTRFEGPTDLSTEARQIAEGAGLDPDTMTREELLEHPDFVAERLRREALAERRAEKSAPRISVGDKSPLTTGATTQTQMWVRSARTELRNLKATTDLLNSPKGQKLFTVQSKFWNEPIARIKDALSASNPADKELLDTLQTAQQGARFGALAILNRFSGKQLTDNERKFTLKATGDPDSLTPTEIRTGLGLVQRKLAQALLDDVDTLENKGLDLKAIRKESEEALGIPQGPKASKGLQGALERIKTAPSTAREEYLKLKQSGASEEELGKFRAAAMEAIRNP